MRKAGGAVADRGTAHERGAQGRGSRPAHTWTDVPTLGCRVHARTWAGSPGEQRAPVVLVHGLGLSSRYLAPLGRRLAALGHRVLAPDLPGFGRSPKPR